MPSPKKSPAKHAKHAKHVPKASKPVSRWWIFYTWLFGIFTFAVIGGAMAFAIDPALIRTIDAKLGANLLENNLNNLCVESMFTDGSDMVERNGYVYKRIKGSIIPVSIYYDGNYPETLSQDLENSISLLVPTAQISRVDIRKSGSRGFEFLTLPYVVFDSQAQSSRLYKQFAGQIEQQREMHLLNSQYLASGVRSVLSRPSSDGLRTGSATAPVTVTLYTDFLCKQCGDFFLQLYDRLQADYIRSGKILFAVKNIPGDSGMKTLNAAKTVRCIGEQGRFEEMQRRIFENTDRLTLNDMKEHVRAMRMGTKEFEVCMMTSEISRQVDADMEDAERLGISRLPALVIGNRMLTAPASYDEITSLIESELLAGRMRANVHSSARDMMEEPKLGKGAALIEYFFDYECTTCERMNTVLRELAKSNTGVTVAFRHFPQDIHPYALKAAVAAECAHNEGKFFEFHDTLFFSQDNLTEPSLEKYARGVGLGGEFAVCLRSQSTLPEVRSDIEAAQIYGVKQVPALVIDGEKIEGSATIESINALLQSR